MLLDVAWPDAFTPIAPEQRTPRPDVPAVDFRWFAAPEELGRVEVALDVYTVGMPPAELFEAWQRGEHEVTEARVRTLACRNGEGSSYAAELGTDLLTVTYLVEVDQTRVTLRTGRASAVVLGAAMLELDEICRTLNIRGEWS